MSKYQPLQAHLATATTSEVPMTFAEIEHVVGASLPPAASDHRAWWSNNPSNNVMTKAWLAAGFKTESVDMAARRLVFRRTNGGAPKPLAAPSAAAEAAALPAASTQARPVDGHHPLFGRLKGTVRIEIDVDLTAPAHPNWGASAS